MSYIGNNLDSDIQVNKYQYTATQDQTTFACTYDRAVDVYVNGLKLANEDFTSTSGVDITLVSGLNAGDIVDINAYFDIDYAPLNLKENITDNDVKLAAKIDKVASTDNAIVRFNGTTGDVQNSGVIIDDNDNVTGGSFNGYGGAGFKNYIINGGFDVWQRGTSFTISGYGADRWKTNWDGTANITTSAVNNLSTPFNGSWNAIQVICTSASGQSYINVQQWVENVTKLAGKTVTVSYWIKALGGDGSVFTEIEQFYGGSSSDYYKSSTVALSANTWTKVTFTQTLPIYYGKSFTSNNATIVGIRLPVNSTFTYQIAQVQLEEGSVATPFEQRPYGLELSLCQRYYETSGSANEFYELPVSSGTQIQRQSVSYKVSKRTVPTVTRTRISYSTSSSSVAHSWEDGFQMDFVGGQYAFESYTWTADAEL